MSNNHPPKKKSTTKKTEPALKTDSTQKPEKTSATSEASDLITSSDIKTIKAIADLMAPTIKFHEASRGASQDDIRIYWDVRIVRGESEHFTQTTGSSSFPGALSQNMKANAPAMIQQEVVDKIASPLVAKMQEECQRQNAARMLARQESNSSQVTSGAVSGSDAMAIAENADDSYIPGDDEGDKD